MRIFISPRWHLLLIFVFCLSLLISSHSPLGTSRFPHALWFSLSLFCGPLRGGGASLLLPHAIRRLWEVLEAVPGLWPTHHTAFPPITLSLCRLEGAALGPYLTWALSVFSSTPCLPSPPSWGSGTEWIASCGPSVLLQPGDTPVSPGGELPSSQADLSVCGITVGFCISSLFFCTLSLQGVSEIYFETFRKFFPSFPARPPFIFFIFCFYARRMIEPKNHSRQYKTAQVFLSFPRWFCKILGVEKKE